MNNINVISFRYSMVTTALIERGEDGTFGIFTPDINSPIIGGGNTVEAAKADFENSFIEIIQFYKEEGKELPMTKSSIPLDISKLKNGIFSPKKENFLVYDFFCAFG